MSEVWGWVSERGAELGTIAVLLLLALLLFVRTRRLGRDAREAGQARRAVEQRLAAIEAAGDAFLLTGSGDRCLYANVAAAALFGYSRGRELYGKTWRALFGEEAASTADAEIAPALRERGRWIGTVLGATKTGEAVPLDVSVSAVRGGHLWVLRNRLAGSETPDPLLHETLVGRAGSPLVMVSSDGTVREWNPEAERTLGSSRTQVLGTPFLEQFTPAERSRVGEQLRAVASTRERRSFEATVPGDEERVLLWNVTYAPDGASQPGALVCIAQDVTGVKHAEREFSQRENLYRLLANNTSDLVGLHDLEGTFTYASPSCLSLRAYPDEELVGKDPYQLSHSDDWKGIGAAITSAREGRLNRTSLRLRTSSGRYVWFEMMVRPIYDERGTVVQLQTSSRDISERKAFEDRLAHQALHEPLTGLPNRTLFMDRLLQAISRARRAGGKVAVMFMDLDRFKIVNDSMGHEAGDRLIAAVARRIRSVVREADTVARLGGDEFGVLLEFNISESDAETVAGRILRELEPPFTFSGQEMYISASVGIAFSSPDVEDPEDLLRYADVAMYRAKREGMGKYRVFDPDVDSRATGRLAMETDLRQAIDREQVFNLYQPIISLRSGRIRAIEALVRWKHPVRGLVGPDEFIPVAEETGLIVALGYLVMRRACEALGAWQAIVGPERPLAVAVNLSSRQFEQPDLAQEIVRILDETGTPASGLRIEITESELMRDTGRIAELKALGLQVVIDDFGTGYSSLAYLKHLQADSLKIDRSFVNGLEEHSEDEAIVRTVVTLAGSLDLDVTAEGIETEGQLALLREIGCGSGQGYLFSRPISAEELGALLEADPAW
ncbi:MAG: EAL domain-containing protein [Gemmatimonadota bacterium]